MRRTKTHAEETRQNILDAAERLFFSKGVAATSLEDIAAEAGVTRGAIYWHFANKADVFMAMAQSVPLLQEDMLDQAVTDGHPDPLWLLEKLTVDALALLAKDERRQRIYAILGQCEYRNEMAGALRRQHDAFKRLQRHITSLFALARDRGLLHPDWDPETAALAFCAMLSGLLMQWLKLGSEIDLTVQGTKAIRQLFCAFGRREASACPDRPRPGCASRSGRAGAAGQG